MSTVDGPVPIDLLSQGTISALGWVGTLLQRMYEIYPDVERPELEPAVVLVDEVDTHMHPEWQRALIPRLKARLPKLQLIATTHSPLVVGGMEPVEVIRLRRAEDSADIVVEPIIQPLKGMRADQILTGPAFDLDTTRDPETAQMLSRYGELLGITRRTAEEETEFRELSQELRVRVPTFPERVQSSNRSRTAQLRNGGGSSTKLTATSPRWNPGWGAVEENRLRSVGS